MRKSIEELLKNAGDCQNLSLGYHRLAEWVDHKPKVHEKVHLGSKVPDVYEGAFKSWKDAVKNLPMVDIVAATTTSPLAFGLGDKNVHETGLTLSHTYGVPMLPGSSIKGAMRRVAAQLLEIQEALASGKYSPDVAESDLLKAIPEEHRTKVRQWCAMFGSTEGMGAITVHDAWFDPTGNGQTPLMKDIVTVHHPKYYQNKDNERQWPTDMDDPTPIEFWSVKPGVKFLFPIQGPEGWRQAAVEVLKATLQHYGLGAKTNTGYGLFKLDGAAQEGRSAGADAGEVVVATFISYKDSGARVYVGDRSNVKLCEGCPPKLAKGDKLKARFEGKKLRFVSVL